ncbi:MAG: helix-turn-helix domain-containing protein [Cyanobacteriota bacterium]|nr:helix-turn-helix domain-containing protein [Cyanobacteriota bacterium]
MPSPSDLSDQGSEALRQLGHRLALARQQAGLNLGDLADRLRLGHEQLQALECGEAHRLPEPVFVVAMARRVASVLNVAIDEPLLAFKRALQGDVTPQPPTPPAPPSRSPRSWRRWLRYKFSTP